jgi:hypothetical protein
VRTRRLVQNRRATLKQPALVRIKAWVQRPEQTSATHHGGQRQGHRPSLTQPLNDCRDSQNRALVTANRPNDPRNAAGDAVLSRSFAVNDPVRGSAYILIDHGLHLGRE